jgi:transposase
VARSLQPCDGGRREINEPRIEAACKTHVAAAVDHNGGLLGVELFPTTPAGFKALHDWLADFGPVERVEGTGAYGAGLSRHLQSCGVVVIEVDRPNRQTRRRNGKSDQLDAIEAARAALSGRASAPVITTRASRGD